MIRALLLGLLAAHLLCCSNTNLDASARSRVDVGVDGWLWDGATDALQTPDAFQVVASSLELVLSHIPRPEAKRWPRQFLGVQATNLFARNAHIDAIRHASEFSFYADDETHGTVVARGVGESGEPFERWLRVVRYAGHPQLAVVQETSRDESAGHQRSPDREANYDATVALRALCVARCPADARRREWCVAECNSAARAQLTVEDTVFVDGDIRVVIESRSGARLYEDELRSQLFVRWGTSARALLEEVDLADGPEFAVVALSPRRRALSVHAHHEPSQRHLFIRDGEHIHEVRGRTVHDYRRGIAIEGDMSSRSAPWVDPSTRDELRFPGDNTIRRSVDEVAFCGVSERDGDDALWEWWRHRRNEVVLHLDRSSTRIVRVTQRLSAWQPCVEEHLAACPFVDVIDGEHVTRVGEILRNVRFEPKTQSLALPPQRNEGLSLRISEEKAERTYLDAVYVEAGERASLPTACQRSPAPAYCVEDGVFYVLEEGDTLELDFEVSPNEELSLVATGHYLPLSPP